MRKFDEHTVPPDAAYFNMRGMRNRYLGSRAWIHSMVAKKKLPPPVKIGGKSLWPKAVIEKHDAAVLARAELGAA